MMLLLDAALRSSAVLLAGLLAALLLHRRSASLRHAVLACTLAGAAIVVPASFAIPGWVAWDPAPSHAVVEGPSSSGGVTVVAQEAGVATDDDTPVMAAALVLWASGAALAGGMLLIGLLQVRRVARRAQPIRTGTWVRIATELSAGIRRKVVLLQTDAPHLLATYGLFRPRVLLPLGAADWPADRIRSVLGHELAHVRRCDWGVQLAADLLCAVYWFNPLAWACCRQLRRDSERAADDAVLASGVNAPEYAAQLLELARTCRRVRAAWAAAVPIAVPSTLERRITAMLSHEVDRTPPSRRAVAAAALLLTAILLPVAGLRGAQNGPLPLSGVVYDQSGAVLPGVALTLEDAQEFKWEATTDGSGRFEFPPVQPGPYQLRAQLIGFRQLSQDVVLKHAGDWDRAVTLQVGDLQETIHVQAQRAAGVRPGPETPRRVRVGGNIRAPMKIRNVNPVYPEAMREAGRDGIVFLEAIIDVNGDVASLRVLGAQVHPDLAAAAMEAVRQWKFTPTLLNGAPVEVKMTVTVNFSLAD